jgi:hypothetical protein
VSSQILGSAKRVDVRRDRGERRCAVLHHMDAAQKGEHRQAGGMPGGTSGGQHVIGTGQVIAERHRRVGPDKYRARVADPPGQLAGPFGLDLQVLRGPRVGDRQRGVEVVHQHASRLTGQGRLDPFPVRRRGQEPRQLTVDTVGQAGIDGDQQAGGQRVVLGLGHQVRRDQHRVGRPVGDDRDLGRPRLCVGPDPAEQQPLGRGHVDVARPADDVRGRAVRGPVAEHRDRLRAAGRVHLGDPEQRARRQHRGVGQAATLGTRRRGHGDLGDPRHLGRDHVHHHRGWIGDQAARHVDTGAVHRHVTLGDGGFVGNRGDGVGRELRLVHQPRPPRRLLQRRLDVGTELGERIGQRVARDPGAGQVHTVEPLGLVPDRCGAAQPHVLADWPDRVQRCLDVKPGPGQHLRQPLPAKAGRGLATQIDPGEHLPRVAAGPGATAQYGRWAAGAAAARPVNQEQLPNGQILKCRGCCWPAPARQRG